VLPGKAWRGLRRWVAKLWTVRGGGLYAAGYILTFCYLEMRSLLVQIGESEGVVDFLTGEILEFFFRFLGDSIGNMIAAFLWPLRIIEYRPPAGIIALGVAFVLFELVLRKRIDRWLHADDEDAESGAADGGPD